MPKPHAERNLIFGVLALQLDFIRRDDLVAAMNAWLLDKHRPLGDILCEQGRLRPDTRTVLDALVAKHLAMHHGDPSKSLAALSPPPAAKAALQQLRDPDIDASLDSLGEVYATLAPQPALADGRRRYRFLRPLAKGGLGVVSVALDEELGREVALKEIQDHFADHPAAQARFLLEGEITGNLEHPGVAPVYGLGVGPDGRPFYAMRLIKGRTLQDALDELHSGTSSRDRRRRAVELRKLLARFVSVCQTMAYAHARGIIHRDLKPSNLLLGPYGETLVVDWGLARALGRSEGALVDEPPLTPSSGDGSPCIAQTQAGSAIGTPQFMSPEQAAGRTDLTGVANDVYSLGATLYNLITGKPPFAREEIGVILAKVQRGDFLPPRQVTAEVPTALEAVCLKAMAREPAERYPTPLALAEDIEHFLADEPVSVYREPLAVRIARFLRRHQRPVAAGAIALVVLGLALLGGTFLTDQARRNEQTQKQAEETAREEAETRRLNEQQSRERAQREGESALRALLADQASSAESNLAAARLRWQATRAKDRQQEALDLLGKGAKLGESARDVLARLGQAGADLKRTEPPGWETRRLNLRNEAANWLTRLQLAAGASVSLPSGQFGFTPLAAISPDGEQVAAIPDAGREVHLIAARNQVTRRLALPDEAPNFRKNPYTQLAFDAADRLELTMKDVLVTWSLPDGAARLRPLTPAEKERARQRVESKNVSDHSRSEPAGKRRTWVSFLFHAALESAGNQQAPDREESPLDLPESSGVRLRARVVEGSASASWSWQVVVSLLDRPEVSAVAWRTTEFASQPLAVAFGPDDRFLFLITRDARLAAVDLHGGMSAETAIPPDIPIKSNSAFSPLVLLPFARGVGFLAQVEVSGGISAGRLYRLWLFNLVVPRLWKHSPLEPGFALDVADDGRLLFGGPDHLVRLRRGESWTFGLDRLALLERSGGAGLAPRWGLNASAPPPEGKRLSWGKTHNHSAFLGGGGQESVARNVQVERPGGPIQFTGSIGLRQYRVPGIAIDDFHLWQTTLRIQSKDPHGEPVATHSAVCVTQEEDGRETLDLWLQSLTARDGVIQGRGRDRRRVWPTNAARHQAVAHARHDALYRRQQFLSPKGPFLVERLEADDPSRGYWRTDLYSTADGKLLHSFGPSGPGRIFARSDDRQLALVVSKDEGDVVHLDLWSLIEVKALAPLGAYRVTGEWRDEPAGAPTFFVFSPDNRWLLIFQRDQEQLEIRRLPTLQRAGVVKLPGPDFRLLFADGGRRVVVFGPAFYHEPPAGKPLGKPFGRVVELDLARNRSEFLSLDDPALFLNGSFGVRDNTFFCVVRQRLGAEPFRISMWDLDSGRKTELSQPLPGKPESIWTQEFRGGQTWFSPDGKQLLLTSFWQDRTWSEHTKVLTIAQLWDLPRKKLLRQLLATDAGMRTLELVPTRFITPSSSEDAFYFAAGFDRIKGPREFHGWKWANGADHDSRRLTLLAAGDDRTWALWRDDKHVFLYSTRRKRGFGLASTGPKHDLVAASPLGRFLVLSDGTTTGLWDGQSGKRLAVLPPGHSFHQFDPRSPWLSTVDIQKQEVCIWFAPTGELRHRLQGVVLPAHPGGSRLVRYNLGVSWQSQRTDPIELNLSGAGDRLALTAQGVIQLWDLTNRRLLGVAPRPGHLTAVRCVAQHVGANLAASSGEEGVILLHDRRGGKLLSTLLGHRDRVTGLAFSSDGKRLISASLDGTVILWSAAGERLALWRDPRGTAFRCLALHPRSGALALGCADGRIVLLDASARKVLQTRSAGAAVQALAFARDGDRLAGGSADGGIILWRGPDWTKERSWNGGSPITTVAFLGKLDLLATGGKSVAFWRLKSGQAVLTLDVPAAPVRALAVSKNEDELLIADSQSPIRVLDLVGLEKELVAVRLGLRSAGVP
jgi:WD40 repeat protein